MIEVRAASEKDVTNLYILYDSEVVTLTVVLSTFLTD